MTKLLLHEDNQAVVFILNAMVSASPVMRWSCVKLKALLQALRVRIVAQWLPSAINRFADALSRIWDPNEALDTDTLVSSICREYGLSLVIFYDRPLRETLVSRALYLSKYMKEDQWDGSFWLWNHNFDALPLVLRNRGRRREWRRHRLCQILRMVTSPQGFSRGSADLLHRKGHKHRRPLKLN